MASESVSAPSCSVVICTRDRPEYLERCLRTVAGLRYSPFDVLVVDNASADSRAYEVASRWGAGYVLEPEPGLSRARNRGARECAGDIVAYLDDDAIADVQWLDGLAAEFSDSRVIAATGRILAPEPASAEQKQCATLASMDRGVQRKVFDRDRSGWFQLANFGAIGSGGNMALRKSAFDQWRGFDPRLGRGARLPACEENYAFFELIERGYRVIYTPAAVITHHLPHSFSELREHQLRMLSEGGAYLAFLLAELPQYRSVILKLMLARVGGGPRLSHESAGDVPPRLSPLWCQAYAALSGAIGYALTRWRVAPSVSSS